MDLISHLKRSWLSSIQLLQLTNFILIGAVSLKTMSSTYYILALQLWWIIPLFFILPFKLFCGLLLFLIIYSTRSSVDRKNINYFISALPYACLYAIIASIFLYVTNHAHSFYSTLSGRMGALHNTLPVGFVFMAASLFWIYGALFTLLLFIFHF